MRSRTSFFNKGIFLNILKRTWPLWAVFFISRFVPLSFVTLVERVNITGTMTEYAPSYLGKFMGSNFFLDAALSTMVIAIIAAMASFSFLFTAKNTNLIASLPVKRSEVFGSAYLAGLLPVIASYFLVALTNALASLGTYLGFSMVLNFNLFYLFINCAEFFVFYSIAVMVAMISSNAIAVAVMYLVFNFLVSGIEVVVRSIICEFSFGVNVSQNALDVFSPVLEMIYFSYVQPDQIDTVANLFAGFNSWVYMIVYLAAALILTVVSALLYKKRRMEAAGDVITFPALRPVFKYGVSVCASLCLGALLFTLFGGLYPGNAFRFTSMLLGLLLGAFVGYFVSEMLIKKTIHVFRGHWTGFAVLCVLAAIFLCSCQYDVLGISAALPEADEIVSASPYNSSVVITDKEELEELLEINRSIIDNRVKYLPYQHGYFEDSCTISFEYNLKDGSKVNRSYQLPFDEHFDAYCRLLDKPEKVLMEYAPDGYELSAEDISDAYYEAKSYSQGEYNTEVIRLTPEEALDYYYNGLIPDILDGNIHSSLVSILNFSWDDYLTCVSITVYREKDEPYDNYDWYTVCPNIDENCEHSVQWFKDKLNVDLLA